MRTNSTTAPSRPPWTDLPIVNHALYRAPAVTAAEKRRERRDFDATCQTCPYWLDDVEPEVIGACVRRAPAAPVKRDLELARKVLTEGDVPTLPASDHWPVTLWDESCGEHPAFLKERRP